MGLFDFLKKRTPRRAQSDILSWAEVAASTAGTLWTLLQTEPKILASPYARVVLRDDWSVGVANVQCDPSKIMGEHDVAFAFLREDDAAYAAWVDGLKTSSAVFQRMETQQFAKSLVRKLQLQVDVTPRSCAAHSPVISEASPKASAPHRLRHLIDRDRAESEQQYCVDELKGCDLCGADLAQCGYVVDGEVGGTPQVTIPGGATMGQWSYMCPSCFGLRGVGVQWGSGQLYERQPSGEWLLVAGFPPLQSDDA